jgi:hypothetical protein
MQRVTSYLSISFDISWLTIIIIYVACSGKKNNNTKGYLPHFYRAFSGQKLWAPP